MGGQHHAPAALPPGKTRYPLHRRAGWAPGPVWTCAKNLAPTGIRSTDRPARRQSLYRLSYQAHSQISRQSANDGCKVVSSTHRYTSRTRGGLKKAQTSYAIPCSHLRSVAIPCGLRHLQSVIKYPYYYTITCT
jgi:hypothetical protein